MTKAELLAALEPFTDEIEIAIGEDGGFSEITGHAYGLSKGGDGWLILDRGGRVELPRVVRPRMETSPVQAVCDRAAHLADVSTPLKRRTTRCACGVSPLNHCNLCD
jgi:hypothetical protein